MTGNPSQGIAFEKLHPSDFIIDEINARCWSRDRLAFEMGGGFGINKLMLDLYLEVGPNQPRLRMGEDFIAKLARAFGTSLDIWRGLEIAWLREPIQ